MHKTHSPVEYVHQEYKETTLDKPNPNFTEETNIPKVLDKICNNTFFNFNASWSVIANFVFLITINVHGNLVIGF